MAGAGCSTRGRLLSSLVLSCLVFVYPEPPARQIDPVPYAMPPSDTQPSYTQPDSISPLTRAAIAAIAAIAAAPNVFLPARLQKAESGHRRTKLLWPAADHWQTGGLARPRRRRLCLCLRLPERDSASAAPSLFVRPPRRHRPSSSSLLCPRAFAASLPRCPCPSLPTYASSSTPGPEPLPSLVCPCLVSCADAPTAYGLPTTHPRTLDSPSGLVVAAPAGCTPCATDAPASTSV
jgi:hypothetical protein